MTNTRRTFLKQTAFAVAGAGIAGTVGATSYKLLNGKSPSDIVNVALIGCKNMGFGVLQKHLDLPDARCIAMCDIDQNILEDRAASVLKTYNQKPVLYNDFRKLLENKDIDAVIVSTPDHWHCLPMIYACEAGKDVYVEKPMANSIEECNLMVKAAKRYNRVVQVGQQQRSGKLWGEIMTKIKSGDLGKLRKVEIWANFNYGIGQKKVVDSPIPNGVDYDFWLGPAPSRDTFNVNRFHGNWRMWWDYGGGLVTDWGVHLLDMALWAGDVKTAPKTILSYGANLSFPDYAHETFDTLSVVFPQDNYIISYEHTAGTENGPFGMGYGLRFICDNATILANRSGYKILPEKDETTNAFKVEKYESEKGREDHDLHSKNFIKCVKSREETACPPEVGRQVAIYAQAANIAIRTGEYKLDWDDAANRFTNSEKANQFVVPEYRKPWTLPKV